MKSRSSLFQSSVPQAGCVSVGIPTSWSLAFLPVKERGCPGSSWHSLSFLGSIKTHRRERYNMVLMLTLLGSFPCVEKSSHPLYFRRHYCIIYRIWIKQKLICQESRPREAHRVILLIQDRGNAEKRYPSKILFNISKGKTHGVCPLFWMQIRLCG